MPTYEYRCRDCGREFEIFQRMSDEPVAPCPGCGAGAERLISGGGGLLFKGEGFYITDHRSESYRERAREESGASTAKKKDGSDSASEKAGSGASGDPATAGEGKSKGSARPTAGGNGGDG